MVNIMSENEGGVHPIKICPSDITIDAKPTVQVDVPYHPLRKFNIADSIDDLRKQMQEQTPLLDGIVLRGQANVWYAKPNVGKTLITIRLLRDAIGEGRILGRDVYYVAADDTASGVVEKLDLLAPFNVNVLAPGYKGLQAKELPSILRSIIANNQAAGSFIILDTLKKFVTLMDKRESSAFAEVVRQFVMKGGSLLGLAHTNKRLGTDGKPIFAGTSDILDDFDAGYTIIEVPQQAGRQERVVQFDCIKSRGQIAQQATFSYSIANGLTYAELLDSVRSIDSDAVEHMKREADVMADADVVAEIIDCIAEGTNTKMAVVREVAQRTKLGRQAVSRIIEKYTGSDPALHRWEFVRGAHGKQVFSFPGMSPGLRYDPEEKF